MSTDRQWTTSDFFAAHPVFTLAEAAKAFPSERGTRTVVKRLRRYIEDGRLKLLERGLYAVVPPNLSVETFQPDPFLVSRALRPDAIFCYHSALDLLGAGHAAWSRHTAFTAHRRPALKLRGMQVVFSDHPAALREPAERELGTRTVERRGVLLRATGPERTLVEGFRRPDFVGGLAVLSASAGGFASLDLALLERVLAHYEERKLWATVGWFLEQHQREFHVPADYLARLEHRRPPSPLYVPRRQRGGVLSRRWNVILPVEVRQGEADGS